MPGGGLDRPGFRGDRDSTRVPHYPVDRQFQMNNLELEGQSIVVEKANYKLLQDAWVAQIAQRRVLAEDTGHDPVTACAALP
jgi:hypothetical protein